MKTIKASIKGQSPILLHNGALADPRNPFTKEIQAAQKAFKKDKSDASFEALTHCEWLGGLYTDEPIKFSRSGNTVELLNDVRIGITGDMIGRCLLKSAAVKESGIFKAAVIVEGFFPLAVGGKPMTTGGCFKNLKYYFTVGAKIGKATVMRTRPRFDDWSAVASVSYIDELVNGRDVQDALARSGAIIGIGDWRPRFGRFSVEF